MKLADLLTQQESMSHAEKHIVDTYLGLFTKLSPISRIQMIERLAKSLKVEDETTKKNFYKSFGAFASDKSAEEIIADIKSSRQFRQREIKTENWFERK